ncbi:unnamed protein product, partial [Laminaria digitata]
YGRRPSPSVSPAFQSSVSPLESPPPPPPPPPAAADRTRSPLARNGVVFTSDQQDRVYTEDGQQDEGQGNRDYVDYSNDEEMDACQHGGASQPVAEEGRGGDHACGVDDSYGHPHRRAGAQRLEDEHPDFETHTDSPHVPLINQ